jgi:hypothetical protein
MGVAEDASVKDAAPAEEAAPMKPCIFHCHVSFF